MFRLLKRRKPKKVVIDLAELNPLKEELEEELKIYDIPESSRSKIIHEIMEDAAKFGLNPQSKPDIVYFEADRQFGRDSGGKDKFPELTVFLDRRDWLFNAATGECMASGMIMGSGSNV